jgi:hypothetical protein
LTGEESLGERRVLLAEELRVDLSCRCAPDHAILVWRPFLARERHVLVRV